MFEVLKDAWQEALAPYLALLWDSVGFWRVAALTAWTAILVAWRFRDRLKPVLLREQYRRHDMRVFLDSKDVLSSRQLDTFLDELGMNDFCDFVDNYRRGQFLRFFRNEANQYLIRPVAKACYNFVQRLGALDLFMSEHFYSYDLATGERVCCLEPELNPNRGRYNGDERPGKQERKQYDEYAETLARLIREVRAAHQRYIRTVMANMPEVRSLLTCLDI